MNKTRPDLICIGCNKTPEELEEYALFKEPDQTNSDYCWQEEGTLNMTNGHFLCTDCYLRAGQPSSPRGWKAP